MKLYSRAKLSEAESKQIQATRNAKGQIVDPNVGKVLTLGQIDKGHIYGAEERAMQRYAARLKMTREQYRRMMKNPRLYQWEDRHENRSHKHECRDRDIQRQTFMKFYREFKNKDNGKNLRPLRERQMLARKSSSGSRGTRTAARTGKSTCGPTTSHGGKGGNAGGKVGKGGK